MMDEACVMLFDLQEIDEEELEEAAPVAWKEEESKEIKYKIE